MWRDQLYRVCVLCVCVRVCTCGEVVLLHRHYLLSLFPTTSIHRPPEREREKERKKESAVLFLFHFAAEFDAFGKRLSNGLKKGAEDGTRTTPTITDFGNMEQEVCLILCKFFGEKLKSK